jgi:hypothetical protein
MKEVEGERWYPVREAITLLDGYLIEDTLKNYCRAGRVKAKKIGPRRQWHIQGVEVLRLRAEWGLDS